MAAGGEEQSLLDRELALEDQDEYYTLLNVSRTASPEEIRSAYRRLCKIYHPDRYQDKEKQEIASRFFKRIQEAYQILSDSRLRSVYDIRGKKGVENDRALIERTSLPTELIDEYEKLKNLFDERTYIQEVNPQGLYKVSLDATDFTSGERGWASIRVTDAYAQQSVSSSLSKSATLLLTGSLLSTVRASRPYTGLTASVRQDLGQHNWVKVSGNVGRLPSVGFDYYRNITNNMYITGENVLHWMPPFGVGVLLNTHLSRKLDDKTTSTFHIKESGNTVGVSLSRQITEKAVLSSDVMIGYNRSYLQLALCMKPVDLYMLTLSGRIGTRGPSLSYSVDHNISKLTQVGGRVNLSASDGVQLRLQFIRASMNYVVKVQVSPYVDVMSIMMASLVPLGLYGILKILALGPLLRFYKVKETEEIRMEREREMKERRREAESAVDLMMETVERIQTNEQSRHGLIILEAWYGSLFSTTASHDPMGLPKVIDVRVPLQCLVADSKLVLRETAKSIIPGFYDPCIGEKKYLRVKYRFRGLVHEITIENNECLVIPRQSHRVLTNEE
ncbi:PREDICTED: dnaJ homolog subfamily C member 11-like [Amphimedon queenslandica]|uniref:J domain-containing protein n=1 Tax=Amphimedon queenslandica TaxID=400682 RepID=A0A1X7VT91_AMPQE|nr:PREDICTED: dnaJ homolog subfamily C member 11-like [Amphimedon queenslandica]|eukprot:XP_003382824.1 PREDICTED: dnaJ homolog subfamily C member 11-like [Amphimedon queenslandica]